MGRMDRCMQLHFTIIVFWHADSSKTSKYIASVFRISKKAYQRSLYTIFYNNYEYIKIYVESL